MAPFPNSTPSTMLSNPPQGGLQARNRQHRRQNSTPTGFEATKIATNLPNMHQQHQQQQRSRMSHRRGMSLDTRRQQFQQRQQQRQQQMQSPTIPPRQEFTTVSNATNNTGSITQQHVLREAQPQRIARPGPQQTYANLASDEGYLMSPHGTPQTQSFDGQGFDNLPSQQDLQLNFDMYNASMNAMMKKNQENFSNMTASQDLEQFPSSALSTPTFMSFQDSPTGGPGWISEGETSSTRRSSCRISNGIMDRVAKFETMGLDVRRPLTPPRQNATDYFPLTPMDTPHDRTIKHSQPPQRFSEGYDESMEETVKPTRQSSSRRQQTTFDEMRQAAEAQAPMPMSNRANAMPLLETFNQPQDPMADFLDMGNINNTGLRVDTTFDGLPASTHPLSASSDLSEHTTPITPHMGEFDGSFDYKPDLQSLHSEPDIVPSVGSPATDMSSRRGTPHHHHRRNESIASIASAASIATIDIEKTKTQTGITLEDIHQYISGPDPRDNKWTCTFEDCNKKFGRKENIKSHVQTHLNDRQYKCPTCNKCFVRQHDLKRHAKIHTGIKPYPCECGNSFARHDALTRHKQRGMCIGAFDGVVRKVVKRGRPRKHRPDMDERKDKSSRTRKKNQSISSISSQSGYSDSSEANSPENIDQDFGMLDDIMDVSMGGTTMNPSSLQGLCSSSAPMPSLTSETPMSKDSPSATSVHSYVSQLSQLSHMSLHQDLAQDAASSQPGSPAKSVASQFNELPELSRSSSPPSGNRYFDAEPNSSGTDLTISTAVDTASIPGFVGMGEADDVLLQFTNNGPSMLMLSTDSKFDEAFDMFNGNDDLFFGSS
ncbi:uncharacterized protein F4822DRAFT_414180 [Hypoxylon trugodes]|uniref:uncharacterized protein n=1 Tax=Hypoxylon trugodes TaxID=326681 RepID=UPI00219A3BDB|nr:uncharacterized protein F4822DRAFT_414180 [Hypoxylon trugodes]KAI1385798.1 hypothetical protein F4822DRAFT_414180 [Hypoxylon trugodes]